MMQGRRDASNFINKRLALGLDLVQIGRAKWCLSRSRKDEVGHLQITDRPVVWRGLSVDFLRDAQ